MPSQQSPQPIWTPELRACLDGLVRAAGFDLAGVAPASSAPSPSAARFEDWLAAGYAGEMEYLKRRNDQSVLLRADLAAAIPWARSVIVCAFNYNADTPRSLDPATSGTGWIARYAWSGKEVDGTLRPTDYHEDLLGRLRRMEAALHEQTACESRCYVDTGPLLERDFAARAGIGWIGKNTCVLNQRLGSWLLLGVIVTSLAVPEHAAPQLAPDRCGSCTRCIDACPTGALIPPSGQDPARQMDASRCIAYLTIEKKGSIPEPLRAPMGRQVFGCDICQEVCPWNTKALIGTTQPRLELVNPNLSWLASMDAAEFTRYFKDSPLERTKRKRLHRNVAIAMGNSGEKQFLPQLELWSASEDPVLAEAAQWAIAAIRTRNPLC